MNFKVGMLITIQHDLEKSFEFYKTLGLTPKFHMEKRWAEFELGGTKLGLCPTEEELPERHTGIVLEVEDIQAVCKDLSAKGITFVNEPKEAPHGIMASIKDPGNNIIDLYQPTPEKVNDLVKEANKEHGCCGGSDACKSDGCDKSKNDCGTSKCSDKK
jgi:predicted enzyme related to lactoylglutathione lyase